ncbi:hypothetical protein QTL97_16655 [Sporosarcina thermotolerans]|uniref:DUF998 domain-containing protein n=1 Tax=Sporosarcina thermotolerans TaxID=633404 RepID=A0AAW9AE03_9BACL|nr:hypothetical protein [Sporosarcina thermotolerans]MDW0118560.1 hypothetical protein [Sporosarcina thermotolerans]WHT49496.1 hypothetical protein QNH10_08270 [Sporosarcina thermotolerans]
MSSRNEFVEPSVKLFEGERWLVITGILGFILAAGIAFIIFFQGRIILPEGNLGDAFSFNAAIGIYILSIAAILPLARLEARKRKAFRWLFIISALYGYAIETIQNFRGFDPRFSREGSVVDIIGGMVFGVVSLVLVILALLLAIQFFRIKYPIERPLLMTGIRYAFISILIANIAGIWMILLQDRFTGDTGNIIVLHGIGFHALQTLIFLGWLLEKVQFNGRIKKLLIHYGSISWTLSILLIGFQTLLDRTVFELTTLPIISGILLLVWLGTVIVASVLFIKDWRTKALKTNYVSSNQG